MGAKRLRITSILIALATTASVLTGLGAGTARAAGSACASSGCWTAPFSPFGLFDKHPPQTVADSMKFPAAASMAFMPDGRIVYWNGLQGRENGNDAGELLDLSRGNPRSVTGVLDLTGSQPIFYTKNNAPGGDDMFCADQRVLETGHLLVTGGTYWQNEIPLPTDPNTGPAGLTELYGSPQSHLLTGFGSSTKDWKVTAKMHYGRWYPTMLTLPSGNEFVAGGTTKLFWNSSILSTADNAIGNKQYEVATGPVPVNVPQTEIYDVAKNGWILNPDKDNIDLPIFARLHLLPDGQIFYSADGQMFGPAGESVNEATWGMLQTLNPSLIGQAADPGWKPVGMLPVGPMGGAFSIMMPLKPPYDSAQVLVGGGVIGNDPGTLLATNLSQLISLTKSGGGWKASSALTGNMLNRRWFGSGVLLPNGQIVVVNGADRDEVQPEGAGTEQPVRQAELYDPATQQWTALSNSGRDRTYHNSAMLLPDGSILVGGHAPINQFYQGKGAANNPLGGNNLKDPSFERFFPPYLYAGPRPVILSTQSHASWGKQLQIQAASSGAPIAKFVLSRMPEVTHITDPDARTVELGSFTRHGSEISVAIPNSRSVLPPGFYYLFAMSPKGVPSVATIVQIADKRYFTGSASAKPIGLASQPYRSSSMTSVTPVVQPAGVTGAAKKAASSNSTNAGLAMDVVVPASKPVAPSPASRMWLIVIAGLMIAIVARRVYVAAVARR
jgi:hypothetical protein